MLARTLVAALAACAFPAAAGAACSVGRIAELPVTMANGYQPMVTAKINGTDVHYDNKITPNAGTYTDWFARKPVTLIVPP